MQDRILPDHGSGHQPDRPRPHGPYAHGAWIRGPELCALGAAVRELRARHGFSQEELGHRSGLHRNYVGAIEWGEINPTFRVLLKLERGLRVPLSELVEVYERQRVAQLGILPAREPVRGLAVVRPPDAA